MGPVAVTAEPERLFDAAALSLEPLARPLPAGPEGPSVEIGFRPAGLDPEARAAFSRLPVSAEFLETPFLRVAVPTPWLDELALRSASAARLALAARLAAAPRPRPRLMGVLNVTPDSFSDGSLHASADAAVAHGLKLVAAGADTIDVGGESTRPGAAPVESAEELERVLPVVESLAGRHKLRVSIDTQKATVARAAVALGASMVNDVSAGSADPEMLGVVADSRVDLCLMHMRGTPRTMQEAPRYEDCLREVAAYLRQRVAQALKAGIHLSRLFVDPGIGFGKRLADNLELIRSLPLLRSLGLPIVVGVSRKSFLGKLSGEESPRKRTSETSAAVALCAFLGADVHRVHDVDAARRAVAIGQALEREEIRA